MKLLIPFLAIAAFVYALWLVVFRRRLPNPQGATGLRKRFYLAVLLFVGLFTMALPSLRGRGRLLGPSCYEAPQPAVSAQEGALATLAAVWLTLDPKQGESFGQKLEAAVQQGHINQQVSDVLKVAFGQLAFHKDFTSAERRGMRCYQMTQLGGSLRNSRANALKQLELLREARKAGKIDEGTAQKCQVVLARELEMFSQAYQLASGDSEGEKRLVDQYSKGELKPGESATEAAAFIVRMETGQAGEGGEGE
jgi:hypothetical protein